MSVDVLQSIILGSRGSELARIQTAMVATALRQGRPDLEVKVEIITTKGDEGSANAPIDPHAGRKGLFTAEIERVLFRRGIDAAVHSAKDLPSDATPGVEVRGALPRAAVDDLLIAKVPGGLASLRSDAVVATGSVRRQYQLQWQHPGVEIAHLRGNVPTRLRKLVANDWDAIILARAGAERLGYELSAGRFSFEGAQLYADVLPQDQFLPAGGQGVIALQVRSDDDKTRELVDRVNHAETLFCLQAEREFLGLLQGDCDSPVGVLATVESSRMKMRAQVFEPGRLEPRAAEVTGAIESGLEMAAELLEQINGG
ncbi:MAG: hydroxymethylbilane synthase [Verrucomicrobiota bacterium]|nr:hydroxymethylbilane synthase [Verrucomicrobiota bacterium]